MFLVLVPLAATGDGGHGHDHGTEVDVASSITGGDVSLSTGSTNVSSSDKAYAFAHGMGDVDINQCMGSEQWSTILVGKQKLVANLWCMAESYDARGLHHMAALMRCDIDVIAKHFEDSADCIAANTMVPAPVAAMASADDEDEEIHQELSRSYEYMQAQLSDLQSLVERAQRPVVRREVVEKGGLTEQQRAQLREVVK
jgi:hypothetical protein